MAVAPASLADKIIVLDDDDDEEEIPQPLFPAPSSSSKTNVKKSSLKAQQSAPTHITVSPFASAKKESDVLQAENEKLFAEFVEHCTAQTKDCPEVITFLQAKHSKASPSFLCSVEFRNTLGRCLTRVQSNRSKMFVYINELCTVLKQHSVKKRQTLTKTETTTSPQPSSDHSKNTDKTEAARNSKNTAEDDEQPSTSGIKEESEANKKAPRKSRKQIAYLENLLKVYNEEIRRIQEKELSLDDLAAEDSLYIQEHKLKRKMMKIHETLCEIKGCDTTTGRVLEQRILYNGSRYPEINKKIERFINRPETKMEPPDYPDILQLVIRANERNNLCLTRKQLNKIAREAFEEVAGSIQERRHLDLVYNFGSHLTDPYKPACDPALGDHSLMQKLRSNRELALDRLKGVITEYAVKQEETEEQERLKRQEKDKTKKEGNDKTKKGKTTETNGVEENEEEEENEEDDEDEDDQSSDPDIEEEIQASTQQDGPEGEASEEEENNEAEQAVDDTDDQLQTVSTSDKEEGETSDLSPMSHQSQSLLTPLLTPLSDTSSPRDSPSQSEPTDTNNPKPLSNGGPIKSTNELSVVLVNTNPTKDQAVSSAENGVCESMVVKKCDTQTSSGTSPLSSPRTTRAQKRKREEETSEKPVHTITRDGETDIPLDMGVFNCDSPPRVTRADTPSHNMVSSSQSTPPPKKNKVNVATQCDPQEVIVLSDSE